MTKQEFILKYMIKTYANPAETDMNKVWMKKRYNELQRELMALQDEIEDGYCWGENILRNRKCQRDIEEAMQNLLLKIRDFSRADELYGFELIDECGTI